MEDQPASRRSAYYLWTGANEDATAHLEQQRTILARLAAARGFVGVAEFADRGATSTDGLAARPGLTGLFVAISQGEVDVALVECADHFSTDPLQRELVLHELRNAGVLVLEARSGERLTDAGADDATTNTIRTVLAAATDFGTLAGVAALRLARPQQAGMARARAEILRLRERRLTMVGIARHLNAMGLRDADDAPWSRQSVFAFLRNLPPA